MGLSLLLQALLAAYIYYRAIHPLKWRLVWKISVGVLLWIAAYKLLSVYLLGGLLFPVPDPPPGVIVVTNWLYAVFFLFFSFLFAENFFRRVFEFLIRKKKNSSIHEAWLRNVHKIHLSLLLFAALLVSIGFAAENDVPEIRTYDVPVNNLPDAADGFSIAVLSDLHVDDATNKKRLERIIEETNTLNPDLIVLAGDMVDGRLHRTDREVIRSLSALRAKYGVYGVPGNHEYYSGFYEWMSFFSSLNIRMLVNQSTKIPLRDGVLYLAGIADIAAKNRPGPMPDLDAALENIPSSAPVILLAHRPRMAREAAECGVSLQISGHTHGGMILGLNLIVALANNGFSSGMYDVRNMKLIVSNGVCIWNGLPVRLGIPAEISLLRLYKAKEPHPLP